MFQVYKNALELVKKFPAVTISHTTKKNNFVKLICPLTVKMKKTTHVHNRNKSQPKIGTFILTKTNGTIPAWDLLLKPKESKWLLNTGDQIGK
jgi:hypothetical protein